MKDSGYTLIEIMIALTIFAIIGLASSSVIYNAFNENSAINKELNHLQTIDFAITLLHRDTAQTVNRPIRSAAMHLSATWIGNPHYVEFTRIGIPNPNATDKRSTMQRIAYICKANKLIRRSWAALDAPHPNKGFQERILLHDIQACSFAYLAQNHELLPEWRQENLPLGLQITIKESIGDLRLLFGVH